MKKLFFSVCLSILLFTTTTLIAGTGGIIRVNPFDQNNTIEDGTSWGTAYRSLHTALAVADTGDCILLVAGDYYGQSEGVGYRETAFEVPMGVSIEGGYPYDAINDTVGPSPSVPFGSILIGTDSILESRYNHVIKVVDKANALPDDVTYFKGLTIKDGEANGASAAFQSQYGAGIYCVDKSLEVEACQFTGNRADKGGAIYYAKSISSTFQLNLSASEFINNEAFVDGGALDVYFGILGIVGCTFKGNRAASLGGAVNMFGCGGAVINSLFLSNSSSNLGGACSSFNLSNVDFFNCSFLNNTAVDGGAIWMDWFGSSFSHCLFHGDTAKSATGAGAISAASGNAGSVDNSILWHNSPTHFQGTPRVNYCIVEGGVEGEGNIDQDPILGINFLGDLAPVNSSSPAIDNGSIAKAIPIPEADEPYIDRYFRPRQDSVGGNLLPIAGFCRNQVDIGPFEYHPSSSAPHIGYWLEILSVPIQSVCAGDTVWFSVVIHHDTSGLPPVGPFKINFSDSSSCDFACAMGDTFTTFIVAKAISSSPQSIHITHVEDFRGCGNSLPNQGSVDILVAPVEINLVCRTDTPTFYISAPNAVATPLPDSLEDPSTYICGAKNRWVVKAEFTQQELGVDTVVYFVEDVNGQRESCTVVVNIACRSIPKVSIQTRDSSYCTAEPIYFSNVDTALTTDLFVWDLGDGSSKTGRTAYNTYPLPGHYTIRLTGTSQEGCTASSATTLKVSDPPNFSVLEDVTLQYRSQSYLVGPAQYDSVLWKPKGNYSHILNPDWPSSSVQNLEDGLNIFELFIWNGGCRAQEELIIRKVPFQAHFKISPNGDGNNDRMAFDGLLEEVGKVDFKVFNKWGQLEYHSEDYQNDWEGKNQSGKELPEGIYRYLMTFLESNVLEGTIMVKRSIP